MATAAPVGSLVITQPSQDYHVSDIITFVQNHKRYTHRITAIDGERLIPKATSTAAPTRCLSTAGKCWVKPGISTPGLVGCTGLGRG